MGAEPSAAASTAATAPVLSGGTTGAGTVAIQSASSGVGTTSASGRFGMPHAFVIIACIATGAILAPSGMDIRDVLFLLGGAGSIGAAVVLMVTAGGRGANRVKRMVDAYRSSGN